MDKIQNIEEIRSQYKNEWLLILVKEIDQTMTNPKTGILVDHSKNPDELWEKASKIKEPVMVVYSEDWPEDLAACFRL